MKVLFFTQYIPITPLPFTDYGSDKYTHTIDLWNDISWKQILKIAIDFNIQHGHMWNMTQKSREDIQSYLLIK